MTRDLVLRDVCYKPWSANAKGPAAFDCWHLARYLHRELFARELPDVEVPPDPSWEWMIESFDQHPERRNWAEVKSDSMGLTQAGDGAIVLMARSVRSAHCGVWLRPERLVIHADQAIGQVICEDLATLRARGWRRLRFYEPR